MPYFRPRLMTYNPQQYSCGLVMARKQSNPYPLALVSVSASGSCSCRFVWFDGPVRRRKVQVLDRSRNNQRDVFVVKKPVSKTKEEISSGHFLSLFSPSSLSMFLYYEVYSSALCGLASCERRSHLSNYGSEELVSFVEAYAMTHASPKGLQMRVFFRVRPQYFSDGVL